MTPAWKRRWFVNSVTMLAVGPLVAALLFGVGWIIERPHPLDAWPMFRAFLAVGFVAGLIACIA